MWRLYFIRKTGKCLHFINVTTKNWDNRPNTNYQRWPRPTFFICLIDIFHLEGRTSIPGYPELLQDMLLCNCMSTIAILLFIHNFICGYKLFEGFAAARIYCELRRQIDKKINNATLVPHAYNTQYAFHVSFFFFPSRIFNSVRFISTQFFSFLLKCNQH
jgi:hypothetical protein